MRELSWAAFLMLVGLAGACRSGPLPAATGPLPDLQPEELLARPALGAAGLEAARLRRTLADSQRTFSLSSKQRTALKLRIAYLEVLCGNSAAARATVDGILAGDVPAPAAALAWALRSKIALDEGRTQEARRARDQALAHAGSPALRPDLEAVFDRWGLAAEAPPVHEAAPPPLPAFVSRRRWGSRRADPRRMEPMGKPDRITIHHSAMPADDMGRDASSQVRGIQRNHIERMHWADIGYHFLIDRTGRIYEGRSLQYQGAHAGDRRTNRHNIGICLLGNFEPGERGGQKPNRPQTEALVRLVLALCRRYRIPPSRIYAHREIHPRGPGATACPGRNLLPLVGALRRRLARHLALRPAP